MLPEPASTRLLEDAQLGDELATTRLVERLAVLATFDPIGVAGDEVGPDVLRLLCRPIVTADGRPAAMLAGRRRVDALAAMLRRGGPGELRSTRDHIEADHDTPLQRMLDAFTLDRHLPVNARNEDELLASLDVWQWATEAIARADQLGKLWVEPDRDQIEGRLALLDVTRAVRRLTSEGCLGRERELEQLHRFARTARGYASLREDPAMVVHGIGGVGKSTLIARFVTDLFEAAERGPALAWAYLDLDRPTLSSCAPDVLIRDILRQVAAQFPDYQRSIRRSAQVHGERSKGAGLEGLDGVWSYRELVYELASFVRQLNDGSLLVVLDTYEELEREAAVQRTATRGELIRNRRPAHRHLVEELYGTFAQLAEELPGFRLVVAGRGPAALFADPERPDRQLHVLPLQADAALEVLRYFVDREAERARRAAPEVDEELGRQIIELVGGIPLTVRLAARVLVEEGSGAVVDAARRAQTLDRVRSELVRGFLYQRILDHVTAPQPADTYALRQVARASLALRQVTAELIEVVLVPALKQTGVEVEQEPAKIFTALAAEVAFVRRAGTALRLREELRGPALAALKLADPRLVARVHALAIDYYSAQAAHDEDAAVELAYHRLATGTPATDIPPHLLPELQELVSELPPAVVTSVDRHRRGSYDVVDWERDVVPKADAALRSGDLARVRELLGTRRERTAGSELHRLESRLRVAEGDPQGAIEPAERDLEAAAAAGDPVRYAGSAVRLAGLHEHQREPDGADDVLRRAGEAELLAGCPELRLELVLNRMGLRERAGRDTAATRWMLELDARLLLQRCEAGGLPISTALVRLLAATLGRDEPELLREAVRRVGLGHEEDPRRVEALIDALVAWDERRPDPGELARLVDLPTDGELRRVWSALAGLGTDAGFLLDRLFDAMAPPPAVTEALRMVYLWWAAPELQQLEPESATASGALGEGPVNWERQDLRELEEIVLTTYPTATEIRVLAAGAGIAVDAISWTRSNRRSTREVLGIALRSGRVDALLEYMLRDPAARVVHQRLLELVSVEWLRSRGLD
jgi:AAA ATPase-like protein